MHMPDFDIFNDTSKAYLNELKHMLLERGERTEIAKGDYFARTGKYCGRIAYVCHGGFKCTCTDSRGRERILSFMFENEFIADYIPSRNGSPSMLSIRAMEDSVVYMIEIERFRSFFEREIDGRTYVIKIIEVLAFRYMWKTLSLVCETPEERYFSLKERVPDIFSRVNLKDIAAYIGVTPETLSRMRTAYLHRSGGSGKY